MPGTALVPCPTSNPEESRPLPPPIPRDRRARSALAIGHRIGPWRIDAELGRGGMGSVYAVTHHGFGKRAALKLCHASILSSTFTPETFLREARVVHLVEHPGVCDVFATGTHDGRPYLAMERLSGETLGARLDRGPLSREESLDLLLEVCDVLVAAHAAGVVHRDLKLENVFLLDAPAPRRTKLLDWGVARVVGEPDPMRGMIAGTITYVAPEQIRGDDLGPPADVYSLGVLAYRTLLGEPPFTSRSDLELLRMHLHAPPPSPTLLSPGLDADLATLLVAMLAKAPAQRPPVTEVRRVLHQARDRLRARPALQQRVRGWLARLGATLASLA